MRSCLTHFSSASDRGQHLNRTARQAYKALKWFVPHTHPRRPGNQSVSEFQADAAQEWPDAVQVPASGPASRRSRRVDSLSPIRQYNSITDAFERATSSPTSTTSINVAPAAAKSRLSWPNDDRKPRPRPHSDRPSFMRSSASSVGPRTRSLRPAPPRPVRPGERCLAADTAAGLLQ